jgi:hypothetical protein
MPSQQYYLLGCKWITPQNIALFIVTVVITSISRPSAWELWHSTWKAPYSFHIQYSQAVDDTFEYSWQKNIYGFKIMRGNAEFQVCTLSYTYSVSNVYICFFMKKYKRMCSISREKKTMNWYTQSSSTVLRIGLSDGIRSSSFWICLTSYTILVIHREVSWKTKK